jgi:RNA polymerase sigma factor (sigma-70 family)
LVDCLLSGDAKQFEKVYDHFASSLLGIIHNVIKDKVIAEDILQEVFIKIWNNSGAYDPKKARLFTWMLNIARNTAIDHTRSRQGKMEEKNISVQDSSAVHELTFSTGKKEEHIGLTALISSLKKEQEEVIILTYFEGHSQSEIAEKLQIPLGTVKTRCRHALNLLRKNFN